jgi:glycosyltransferase involved in cell wall biosynthesis
MKILIWCPHVSFGGGIRLLQQLAPAIARHPEVDSARLAIVGGKVANVGEVFRGLEIFELSEEGGAGVLRSWLKADGRVLGIRGTDRLKASARYRLLKPLDRRREQSWQREQLEEAARGCDVVYCFWPQRLACPQLDLPLACTYQDTTLIDFPETLGGAEAKRLKDLSAGWVERSTVVVSSKATRDNLVRLFGPRAESARVIHHAILPEKDKTATVLSDALAERLPRDYVVLPAHVSPSKNHQALMEAWARFGRRKESALVFLGAGTERINRLAHEPEVSHDWHVLGLLGLIARHQLRAGEDFHALGYVEDRDVLSLVGNAKALVMPTLAEGGGSYPVEEALAVGTPVLCSDIPVMREHLRGRSAKIGWFDPYSVDSILSALEDLFDNYDAYKQSAVRGAADPRPTWDDVAAQYVEVFKGMRR